MLYEQKAQVLLELDKTFAAIQVCDSPRICTCVLTWFARAAGGRERVPTQPTVGHCKSLIVYCQLIGSSSHVLVASVSFVLQAHLTLGRAQLHHGEVGMSLQSLQRAVMLDPTDKEVRARAFIRAVHTPRLILASRLSCSL